MHIATRKGQMDSYLAFSSCEFERNADCKEVARLKQALDQVDTVNRFWQECLKIQRLRV